MLKIQRKNPKGSNNFNQPENNEFELNYRLAFDSLKNAVKTPKQFITYPIGLQKINNNCYANVILQIFLHLYPKFINTIFDNSILTNTNEISSKIITFLKNMFDYILNPKL